MWISCKELIDGGFRGWRPTLGEVFRLVRKGLFSPYNGDGSLLLPIALYDAERDLFDSERRDNKYENEIAQLKAELLEDKEWGEAAKSRIAVLEDNSVAEASHRYDMFVFLDEHKSRPWESIPFTPQEHRMECARLETQAYFMVADIETLLLAGRTESTVDQPVGNGIPPAGGETVPQLATEERNKRIIAEGKALDTKYAKQQTILQISQEVAKNNGDLAPKTIVGILRGHGIGRRGRPATPVK